MTNDFNEYTYLCHHGVLGMKWGVRRYQNPDGTLTAAGRKRYGKKVEAYKAKEVKRLHKEIQKAKRKGEDTTRLRKQAIDAFTLKDEDWMKELAKRSLSSIDRDRLMAERTAIAKERMRELEEAASLGFRPEGKDNYEKVIPKGSEALNGTSADKDFYFNYNSKNEVSKEIVDRVMNSLKSIDKNSQSAVINDVKKSGTMDYFNKKYGSSFDDEWLKKNTNLFSIRYIDEKGFENLLEVNYDVGDLMVANVEYDLKNNKVLRIGYDN